MYVSLKIPRRDREYDTQCGTVETGPTPKGLCYKAQGCRTSQHSQSDDDCDAATLGMQAVPMVQPQRGCDPIIRGKTASPTKKEVKWLGILAVP